jgi:hypothetical protein
MTSRRWTSRGTQGLFRIMLDADFRIMLDADIEVAFKARQGLFRITSNALAYEALTPMVP